MTQSSFPFEQPARPDAFVNDFSIERGRRPQLLAGGLVAALVLGVGGYALLGGSGVDDLGPTSRSALAVAAPAAEAPAAAHVPPPSDEQYGRNPFKARYVEPVAAPAPPAPPAPVAPPVVPLQVTIQAPPQPPAAEPKPSEYPLQLVAVRTEGDVVSFDWLVDGKAVTTIYNQRFGKYGELIVLTMRQGDKGPETLVQVGDANPTPFLVGETKKVL